jgi:hypothetical protein
MKNCLILSALFALGFGGGWFFEHSSHRDAGACTRGATVCAAACECGDDCSCCAHCVCVHRK